MKYKTVTSTDFFESANYQSVINRLENIQASSERKWGSMTVSQMLHHLNLAIGSGLAYYNLPDAGNIITRTVNKFLILRVLKRFPVNTKTAGPLLVVSNDLDF